MRLNQSISPSFLLLLLSFFPFLSSFFSPSLSAPPSPSSLSLMVVVRGGGLCSHGVYWNQRDPVVIKPSFGEEGRRRKRRNKFHFWDYKIEEYSWGIKWG